MQQNNVRRQRFHNKRALARTRYETFGATEQDLGLKEVYGQQIKVRTLIKSCVTLALIPPEDVIMGFDQVCSASENFPQIKCYLEYFEETWLGSPGRLGKRSKPLFSITLWNQFENARNGNQKTNNNVES